MAEGATSLSAGDVKNVTDEINKYTDEVDKLAKDNGIDVKIVGNDPAELTKAAAAGAATGAATGAALGAAAGPFFPVVVAAGAIIGAIAGFLAKFHFGPSPEAVALAAEFDQLNKTIHAILLTVPEPYRDQLALVIRNALKRRPGPFWFCLEAGGCAMTSIEGLRDTAATLQAQIKMYLEANTKPPFFTARRVGLIGLGVAAIAGLGYAAKTKWPRSMR